SDRPSHRAGVAQEERDPLPSAGGPARLHPPRPLLSRLWDRCGKAHRTRASTMLARASEARALGSANPPAADDEEAGIGDPSGNDHSQEVFDRVERDAVPVVQITKASEGALVRHVAPSTRNDWQSAQHVPSEDKAIA